MEIAWDLREDTHAGTPPLAVVRYVISDAASGGRANHKRKLGIHDVTCAFMHASMEGEKRIWVLLPPGLAPPGTKGELLMAINGTRRASFLWGEEVATKLSKGGFQRLKGCGQLYFHEGHGGILTTLHGDDFLTSAEDIGHDYFDKFLRESFKLKHGLRIGPGALQEGSFLNRRIAWVPEIGFRLFPNSRHVDEVLVELQLENAKPVAAPAVRHGGTAVLADSLDLLSKDQADMYARCTGKLIYYSADRLDVMFVVRELAQELAKPTKLSMLRLRHLAKYLLGTKDWCWLYAYQDPPRKWEGYGDSDWAANKETRKSVSCGITFHGSHFIEAWVSGQQVVALSSGEAEFYALGKLTAHLLFFIYLLKEMSREIKAVAHSDSSAARGMTGRTGPGRVKHLQTRFLWLQERVREKAIEIAKVDGKENVADLGTKILDGETVRRLSARCGLGPTSHTGVMSKFPGQGA